ncbi:hypothetical protein [Thiothrix sp.]|jgi:hypothetical protein|uniref:hypothetical protein n=1 Tax=Thiothrix sp. TaxID=1032 RepID=UPI002579F275|nr:hypothetical protein [Thiothrix sp.]
MSLSKAEKKVLLKRTEGMYLQAKELLQHIVNFELAIACYDDDQIHATYDNVNVLLGEIVEHDNVIQRILKIKPLDATDPETETTG